MTFFTSVIEVLLSLLLLSPLQVILSTNIAESSVTVSDVKYGGNFDQYTRN